MSGTQDFWARRRAGVAAEAEADKVAAEIQALAEDHATLEEMNEADMLAALDLPDPDTLVQGDDFTVFMANAVPDVIRRRALRALWRTNPVLANVDMLVDYGEDFTDAAMAVENIQTAYQVGKGMLKHVEEMARKADELVNPTEPEVRDEVDQDDDTLITADDTVEQAAAVAEIAYVDPAEADETVAAPAPRRMKFKIEETA